MTFLIFVALALAALPARAIIDTNLQMQLGNPSGATADTNNHNHYLLQRSVYVLDYSDNLGEPNWVSWDLTAADVGSAARQDNYRPDTDLPGNFYHVTDNDYNGVGGINFNRGHMCPSEDRTDTTNDNSLVFFMSNIIPQAADNNQGPWASFEGYCRTLAQAGNELLIVSGPSGFGTNRIPSGKAVIADYTWKVVVVVGAGPSNAVNRVSATNRVIAIKMPNTNGLNTTWQTYITSANQIQVDTGLTFFTALPTNVAAALRSKVDGQTNPPPGITSFSPTSGAASTNVVITGTNFDTATAVQFNGFNATFTVNSDVQITATVPTNATTGPISVTTPSGTAISSNNFTITGAAVVDLAVTVTHLVNFTQGDVGRTYLITVTNIGGAASSGAVAVADVLPSGLTATAISGTGWTTNLGTLTCTRADALAAGAGYPPITLTVTVASNAPTSVTNSVTISGGGDANAGNNSASDVTGISQLTGIVGGTNLLAGWDVNGPANTNFGISPLPATTNAVNLTVVGWTRASGVGTSTSGTPASHAWGGTAFTSTSSAAAVAANQFVTCSLTANSGYQVSYGAISRFDYRRSGTGPTNGLVQYQVGAGGFTDLATVSYSSSSSSGASLGTIDLSGIAALQNIAAGTLVTFRIVNWGATSSQGTWYIYDVAGSSAPDFVIQGTVTPVNAIPTTPRISAVMISGANLILNATNGTPGVGCSLLVSTNAALPRANWSLAGSNVFNGSGAMAFTNTVNAGAARQFFMLRSP